MKTAGTAQPLIDGIEKVTGRARYTADLPADHALVGEILRSPIAHGEIVRIDTARARRSSSSTSSTGHFRSIRVRRRRARRGRCRCTPTSRGTSSAK